MRTINLVFKKLGNHWYPNLNHSNPTELILNPVLEKYINRLDEFNDGIVNKICLIEQTGFIINNGLIQFDEKDIFRYFTTNDDFIMKLYISGHKFTISSKLYNCLENEYKLDLHECIYRISIL